MLRTIKTVLTLTILVLLTSCSKLDDYMLGKDNTAVPQALEPIVAKVHLKQKWVVPIGTSQKSAVFLKLKPVIQGNIIYTADPSGGIYAVNKASGAIIWSKKINAGLVSGPVVGHGYIAVGTNSSTLILLKQDNGNELWQAAVSGDILAKPVIVSDKVIAKTIDGNLYAFELTSGKKLWVYNHGSPSLILKASSSPVIIDGKMILVGYSDGKIDEINLRTGQVIWQRSIAYASGSSDIERLVDIDADPVVQGNTAFLATYQGYLGAFSLTNGQFTWRKPASTYNNILVREDAIYMTDSNDTIWSVNKHTGQVNWKQVGLKARGLTEIVFMGDRLIVGDKTGLLTILSSKNGGFIGRTQLSGAITIAPTVAGKNIYVMTSNGKLNRFFVSN